MKPILVILTACLIILATAPVLALGPLDASAELGLFSKYVWRGMVVTDDPVLQPAAGVSVAGFGASFWGNIDLTDVNGSAEDPDEFKGKFNEIDYTLTYGLSLPMVSLNAGFIHYTFPNTGFDSTTEIFASASANVLLSPSLAVYYDFDEVDAAYIAIGASHGVPMSPVANLDLAMNLGYGTKDYQNAYFGMVPVDGDDDGFLGVSGAGLTDLTLSVRLPYHPVPMLTITPAVFFSTLMGDAGDLVDAGGGDKDALYFGVTCGVGF
ncbi:MAG: TorF family putative porin [Candidatus Krumholzibacteriia bacterium]